ncbi:tetratricopeptide repeat protein, partial [Myxococcota bacterium]|nr:tetratricopeptide repeat protein [Myxococcota bacterium]
MDFTDPPNTPSPEFDDEGIEIAEDIMEIDDDLLEEVEVAKPVRVAIKPPPMPPVPELPDMVAKNTGDIPFVYVAEPEKAYTLPFANDLKDYATEVEKQSTDVMLQRYVAMAPVMTDTLTRNLYLYMGASLAELTGDLGGALKYYGAVLDGTPALRPNLWGLRSLISQKGLLEKTDMLFGVELKTEEDSRRHGSLLYLRGMENEAIGNFDKAETFFREALNYRPGYPLALLALIRLREINLDLSEASELYCEVTEQITDPVIKAAFLNYSAHLSRKIGNYAKAEECATQALALDPERATDCWFEREMCQRLQGDMGGLFALLMEKANSLRGTELGEAT